MKISEWPAHERPLEKLISKGATFLTDAELLALFIRSGLPGLSAVDIARQLIKHHHDVRHVLELTQNEFCSQPGLGVSKYGQLQGALELGRRYLSQSLGQTNVFTNVDDTRRYLISELRTEIREVFAVLLLDNQHHMIGFERLFYGTVSSAAVYPREVVKLGLSRNASAIILAHNHPSGHCEPSDADKQVTAQIKRALMLVDIKLLDHFIIGEGMPYSFAENGLC